MNSMKKGGAKCAALFALLLEEVFEVEVRCVAEEGAATWSEVILEIEISGAVGCVEGIKPHGIAATFLGDLERVLKQSRACSLMPKIWMRVHCADVDRAFDGREVADVDSP